MTIASPSAASDQLQSSAARHAVRALPLLLILLAATALRLHDIGRDSLWGDEALTWTIAKMSPDELIKHDISWEQIPPVHHFVIWGWIKVFGDSETSLRMPSALAGVAGVAMMFVFVRRLLGCQEAFAAATLLAFAPLHVAYAQEVRTYTLAFFVAILCCDLFVRVLRNPTPKLQAAYVIVAALLIYCHLYGVFVLASQQLAYLAWYATTRGPDRPALHLKRWLILMAGIAALYSAWVPIVIGWMRAVSVSFWVKRVTWDDISNAYWVLTGATPIYLLLIASIVPGVAYVRRKPGKAFTLTLLLALTLLPVLVPVTISILGHPSFAPRYALMAGVGFYPLAGAGIAAIRFASLRIVTLVLAALLGIAGLRGEAVLIPKAPWREAVAYVEQHASNKDIVVVHIAAKKRIYDYYDHRPTLPVRRFDTGSLPLTPPLNPGRHIWFVRHEEWVPLRVNLQSGPWHVVSHRWFGDILVMELDDQMDKSEMLNSKSETNSKEENKQ